MPDFLLELRSEEIPARMQAAARRELERLFVERLGEAGLGAGAITVFSTPRRLALIARGLADATQAVREEAKGPPEGAPDAAIDGFCRKNNVTRDQLELRDVKGRPTWFAVIDRPGRPTRDLLAEAVPAIVRAFAWPKSMRWGAASQSTESLRWVRPLSGIVALLDGELVEFEIDGIASGRRTAGHRFHHQGMLEIAGADSYAAQLRDAHVIVDQEERAAIIRDGAARAAADAGFALVADEGLVIENAGLTEWPVPLLGRFDPAFLDVPPEVIQLTARVNQQYFVCTSPLPHPRGDGGGPVEGGADMPTPDPSRKREGDLAPAFVCVANIAAKDGGTAIVAGNEKVLAARLSDAKFFWDLDRKKTLDQHAEKLGQIVFHDKLGTIADKVDRVAQLARWLVEQGIVPGTLSLEGEGRVRVSDAAAVHALASAEPPHPNPLPAGEREQLAALAERAARLAKADLVTEMVGEFPELQGIMGGYYAEHQDEDPRVAAAIRDHYKPVGQGDAVPTDPVTVAVSLADKLDTLVGFFSAGMYPSGSRDPFALRRSAISTIALVLNNTLSLSIFDASVEAYVKLRSTITHLLHANATARFEVGAGLLPDEIRDIGRQYIQESLELRLGHPDEFEQEEILPRLAFLNDFIIDRLKVQQREAGVRHDLIDAVFALGGEDDLVRLLARVRALQAFMETEDGANLLAGYKRAANILKKEGVGAPAEAGAHLPGAPRDATAESGLLPAQEHNGLSYTPEKAEKALIDAVGAAEERAMRAIADEDFEGAMAALAALRAPIDAFFDDVTVNDADPDKRAARLALLARFRGAVHRVADFSRIEG